MKTDTTNKGFHRTAQKHPLSLAVNVALCIATAPLAVLGTAAQAQEPAQITISDAQSFIFLDDQTYPQGGRLVIESTGSAEAIVHSSTNGTSVWEIDIAGVVNGYGFGIDDYDPAIDLENGGAITIRPTGEAGPILLQDGGFVRNEGLIGGLDLTDFGGGGTIAIEANSGQDGIGIGESFTLENTGLIGSLRSVAIGAADVDTVDITNDGVIAVVNDPLVGISEYGTTAIMMGGNVSNSLVNNGAILAGVDPDTGERSFDAGQFNVVIWDIGADYDPELDEYLFQAPTGTTTIVNTVTGVMEGDEILNNAFQGNRPGSDYQLNFTNQGNIVAAGGFGYAFGLFGQVNFSNSGNILVDEQFLANRSGNFLYHHAAPGSYTDQALTLTNEAGGLIQFTGTGIVTNAGVINNAGTIQALGASDPAIVYHNVEDTGLALADWSDTASVINTGVIQAGGNAIWMREGVSRLQVDNAGTISSSAARAIIVEGGTLDVVNRAGGIIEGGIDVGTSPEPELLTEVTILNEGTIAGGISLSTGSNLINNSGELIGPTTMGAGNDTFENSGRIQGSVDLGAGDDVFALSGESDLSGDTLIDGGIGNDTLTLTGSGQLDATLIANFEVGVVDGTAWTIDGSANISAVEVVNGLLQLNDGLVTNNLLVNAGAQLIAGDITGSVTNAGEFSIGGGSLVSGVIDGNFVNESTGVLVFDALDSGLSDSLTITGTATLNGGQLMTLSNDAEWSVARNYTVLTAQEGLTGTFAEVTSNLAYLTPELSYTANDVLLSLTRRNAEIQQDILDETNSQQLSVANRVVPAAIQNQVSKMLTNTFRTSGGVAANTTASGLSAGDAQDPSRNVWVNITPTRSDRRAPLPGVNGLQSIDGRTVNALIGMDTQVGEHSVVGAFAGYEDATYDIDAVFGEQETDGYLLGLYAGIALNDWLYASVNGHWASLSTRLEERAFGIAEAEVADYDSNRTSVGVDLTATRAFGQWLATAQLAYNDTRESYDSYKTLAGETVELGDLELGRVSAGGELLYSGELFSPYLSVSYEVDTRSSVDTSDDNGLLIHAGVRAYTERFYFDAYISTVESRDNESMEMLGLNASYAL